MSSVLHRAKLKTQDPSGVQKAERQRGMASAALSRRGNEARGLSPSLVNILIFYQMVDNVVAGML